MYFYDIFAAFCKQHGESPSKVADKLGIGRSSVTAWKKNGSTPLGTTLTKIAKYFDMSIDDLLNAKGLFPGYFYTDKRSYILALLNKKQISEDQLSIKTNIPLDKLKLYFKGELIPERDFFEIAHALDMSIETLFLQGKKKGLTRCYLQESAPEAVALIINDLAVAPRVYDADEIIEEIKHSDSMLFKFYAIAKDLPLKDQKLLVDIAMLLKRRYQGNS